MKKYLSLTIAMTAFLLAGAAQAQTSGSNSMRAQIPFAFHVGNKELPAGEYKVTVLNPQSDRKVLQSRSSDGRAAAIVNTVAADARVTANSRLVFHRYGANHFFAEAQVSGEPIALTAVKSRAEKTEALAAARQGSKGVIAVIVDASSGPRR